MRVGDARRVGELGRICGDLDARYDGIRYWGRSRIVVISDGRDEHEDIY